MKNYLLTHTAVLCLTTSLVGTAHAGKLSRHYKRRAVHSSLRTDSVSGDSIIQFARTLIGVPYRTAMCDPLRGFDCSGFVNYVFKNFNFDVPRSSAEFANIGERISLEDAKPGDIIIFTSPTRRHQIGHMGIV